jgi:hypothetical protein
MQADAAPSSPAPVAGDRDIDNLSITLQKTPEHCRTAMAERHPIPACKDSRHPPAVRRESEVPNRIYPAVKPVKMPSLGACRDRMPPQPRGDELRE